jgi:hypothetical protein
LWSERLGFAQGVSASAVTLKKSRRIGRSLTNINPLYCESLTQSATRFAGLIWTVTTFVLIYQVETTT